MVVLHTSDWHIGKSLYGKQRYSEIEAFIDWLLETIESRKVDILLIAGDIFDTATPGNRSQSIYYNFLHRISQSHCREVVITAGNHDSPTLLAAPKQLLKHHNIHICSDIIQDREEIIEVKNSRGEQELIICAVPYLRDRDIRKVHAGESLEDKSRLLVEGIKEHYQSVADRAMTIREGETPVITMGHLFASGGKTVEGDGVRELYVGSLSHVNIEIFPELFSYVALGHLHVHQRLGGTDHIRYSGTPIPMGFGESSQTKKVVLIDISNSHREIETIDIPEFQLLKRVEGDRDELVTSITSLKELGVKMWLEVEYTGKSLDPTIQETLLELVEDSDVEIRVVKNRINKSSLSDFIHEETHLEDLNEEEVFDRCLDSNTIPESDRPLLKSLYNSVLESLGESVE